MRPGRAFNWLKHKALTGLKKRQECSGKQLPGLGLVRKLFQVMFWVAPGDPHSRTRALEVNKTNQMRTLVVPHPPELTAAD